VGLHAAAPAPGRAAGRATWAVGAAISTTVVIWASAFVAIRAGLKGYSPTGMAALRFLVASAVLGIRAALRGRAGPGTA
jgi:drug/metabolite transporter (DMT)-like permease